MGPRGTHAPICRIPFLDKWNDKNYKSDLLECVQKALGQGDASPNKGAWHTSLVARVHPQSPIKAVGENRLGKVGLWPPQSICGNRERPNHHKIYKRANKNHFTASLHGSRLRWGVREMRLQVRGQSEPYLVLGTDKMAGCVKVLALKA